MDGLVEGWMDDMFFEMFQSFLSSERNVNFNIFFDKKKQCLIKGKSSFNYKHRYKVIVLQIQSLSNLSVAVDAYEVN